MGDTFLLTGGAGNLACQLTFDLAQEGHRVVLFDVAEAPQAPVAGGCVFVRGDITSREDIAAALSQHRPQRILHFASLLAGSSEQDRELAWRVNMTATFSLFELAVEHGVRQVFFPSSLASWGGKLPNPLPEDFSQWPDSLYGVCKMALERLGVYYHEKHGLDFRCLRLPVVLSAFAPAVGAASAYASRAFVEGVRCGQFTFRVRPQTRASTMYIKDVLRAIVELIEAPAQKLTRRVYNIHAIAPSAQQIADAVISRIPDAEMVFEPDLEAARLIESWPTEIDDASARRDWGWQPQYSLETLADDFIQDLRREAAAGSPT